MAGDAGLAVRAGLPEQRRTGIDPIHRRIDERIGGIAILDRLRPLGGIVERIGELGRRLQGLEERHDVPDLVVLVEAVLAPRRHHRLRIVDARIEDVVEEPLVGASGRADLRQVGADVARHFQSLRSHDVTGQAPAAAAAVEGKLLADRGIALHLREHDLAAFGRRDVAPGQRVVIVPARLVPVAVALPRLRRRGAFELQRGRLLREDGRGGEQQGRRGETRDTSVTASPS